MYKYSIEIFYKDKGWITEIRFYNVIKSNQDFDTKPIAGLRRNCKCIDLIHTKLI